MVIRNNILRTCHLRHQCQLRTDIPNLTLHLDCQEKLKNNYTVQGTLNTRKSWIDEI